MPRKGTYAQGGAYAQKAYAQRLMPKEELMPKTGLMPKNPENKTHHVPPVVTPEAAASDQLLVSRATRKILSPFGVPLMYSLG